MVSSPAVVDGVVYLGSWDHKVYAFGSSPKTHLDVISDLIVPILIVTAIAISLCILLVLCARRRKGKNQLVGSVTKETRRKRYEEYPEFVRRKNRNPIDNEGEIPEFIRDKEE